MKIKIYDDSNVICPKTGQRVTMSSHLFGDNDLMYVECTGLPECDEKECIKIQLFAELTFAEAKEEGAKDIKINYDLNKEPTIA
ncbi:MAG: hypothetical protein N4A47_05470 [Clostridia bacterium]|jgi:hypothetical protein|nr:hypothetical protein [Clostridia bacterium]